MEDVVFIGDWIKDRLLGSGSFGTVLLWKHKRTDERLAIKTCRWSDELTEKHKERWAKEVEMLQNCNHPNIVGTKELPPEFVTGLAKANPSKLPILCMEYCSGGDLRQVLNRPDACAGLRELQVRQILGDICSAMQFLHINKITHRDLKPENIVMHLVDNVEGSAVSSLSPKRVVYKLIDLGYAKEIDCNSVCASFVGTLQYLAPEILYSKSYSNSVDFWSFGLLAFEIICGTRPFLPYMAPVQWMPHVKKKAHEIICVYETFHGDIEYSENIFPENYITKPLKTMLEEWLRIALEWDPKVRGRGAPSKVTFHIPSEQKESENKIVIFSNLENILSKKIIKIFCVSLLTLQAYEINDNTTVKQLKVWLEKDVLIPIKDQLIISPSTYLGISNEELITNFYNDNCGVMMYMYNKNYLVEDNIEPIVPKTVQRCLEHPTAAYNFKNSQNLYRNSIYFVQSQAEIYDHFMNGLLVRAESLKQESKQMLLKHNTVDKTIGKLITKEETIFQVVDKGKKHIEKLKENATGINVLGGFDKNFKDAEEFNEKVSKLQSAWTQLSVRLQSASRRSNELLSNDLKNFLTKYNYQTLYSNAIKTYIAFKKEEINGENKSKEKQCCDIVKVCYDCLKLRTKIFTDVKQQPFIIKIMDLSIEFSKISEIITNAAENIIRLTVELENILEDLNSCIWNTISLVCSDPTGVVDLPYGLVSFEKRDFNISDSVSNCIKVPKNVNQNDNLRSLIEDSLKIRHSNAQLNEKIYLQKKFMQESVFDFSFLND